MRVAITNKSLFVHYSQNLWDIANSALTRDDGDDKDAMLALNKRGHNNNFID